MRISNKQKIIKLLSNLDYAPLKVNEILLKLGMERDERKQIKNLLKKMTVSKLILKLKSGGYVINNNKKYKKAHLLHLLKHTALEKEYEALRLRRLEKDEYVGIVCDQLESLPPDMIIHRLTGDGPPDLLIGPLWSLKKWEVLNAIDAELKRRGSYQGFSYTPR